MHDIIIFVYLSLGSTENCPRKFFQIYYYWIQLYTRQNQSKIVYIIIGHYHFVRLKRTNNYYSETFRYLDKLVGVVMLITNARCYGNSQNNTEKIKYIIIEYFGV
jgi:hypothetical protein